MDELIAQVQRLAEFIGPNAWLQAAIIAAVFIVAGKIADWIISRIIGRFAKKSDNEFDDRLVKLVHHPVFMSFVLAGLGLATQRLDLPPLGDLYHDQYSENDRDRHLVPRPRPAQ